MSMTILKISDNFWNIRGSFKIAGLIDIGTQASLVRQANGKFVFLDSITFDATVEEEIDQLTHGGKDVEAILNLHPFHTVHVPWMHTRYPRASHYGTARHLTRFPELKWQPKCTEDPKLHSLFSGDFDFSVPDGVDFISADENIHFSSVLAFHRASRTIHVDDTLMYIRVPLLMRWSGLHDSVSFHLTLAKALQRRPGAASEFRRWAEQLAENWNEAENLCAAHTATLRAEDNNGASIVERLIKALDKVATTLKTHENKF